MAELTRVWEHDRLLRLWAVAPRMYDAALDQVADHSIEECRTRCITDHAAEVANSYADRCVYRACIWHALIQEIDQ